MISFEHKDPQNKGLFPSSTSATFESGRNSSLEDVKSLNMKTGYKRFFLLEFLAELRRIICLAIPIMFTSLVTYTYGPISVLFCGQLGKTELASVGLAVSVFNVTGLSIVLGLLTASDTLFSQTFGGQNKFNLGIQLQKSIVIVFFCSIPCLGLHVCAEPILLLIGQPPRVCKLVAEYLLILIPGLLFAAFNEVLTKYVQVQNITIPPMVVGIIGSGTNALLHYVFIYHTKLGFHGSALAQSISYALQASLLFSYILASKVYKNTWNGMRVELWHNWDIWFRLAIPGLILTSLEWWMFEAGSIVAGLIGEDELAAQIIINSVISITFTLIPEGLRIATNIRIGQLLGANMSKGPKMAAFVSLFVVLCYNCLTVTLFITSRGYLSRLFSMNAEVIATTAAIFPSATFFQFFDAIVCVSAGVVRGSGLQKFGAIICFTCVYMIGAPLGIFLTFYMDLGATGFWWGLGVGSLLESIIYITMCFRIDWKKQAQLAVQRTQIPIVGENECISFMDNEEKMTQNECQGPESSCTSTRRQQTRTKFLIFKRILLLFGCLATLVISVACRLSLNWSDYFPSYCVLENGTLVALPKSSERLNLTRNFDWIQNDCRMLLPTWAS